MGFPCPACICLLYASVALGMIQRWWRRLVCLLVVVTLCAFPSHSFLTAGVSSSSVVNDGDGHRLLPFSNLESPATWKSENHRRRRGGRSRPCHIASVRSDSSPLGLGVDGRGDNAEASGRTGTAAAVADSLPTVLNPRTKRRIRVGGRKWNEVMSEGGLIMHNGVLKRMKCDLLMTETGQRLAGEESEPPQREEMCHRRYDEGEREEGWFTIEPSISSPRGREASSGGDSSSPVDDDSIRGQVLFVHKPSGLLSVPGIGPDKADCLSSRVSSVHPGAKPCHRLDRDTSGVVVFGLSAEAHREVSRQFELRSAAKTYVALVAGHPSQDDGFVDLPIGKRRTSEGFNRWVIGGEKSREARTRWRVLRRFDLGGGACYSRVELTPLTGRGQQLRLHMASMGHPILGDTIHATGDVANAAPRLCLHAERLAIEYGRMTLVATSAPPF